MKSEKEITDRLEVLESIYKETESQIPNETSIRIIAGIRTLEWVLGLRK